MEINDDETGGQGEEHAQSKGIVESGSLLSFERGLIVEAGLGRTLNFKQMLDWQGLSLGTS